MIKRILHTITAFVFLINQLSVVYAMDPPDKSFTDQKSSKVSIRVHRASLPLPLSPLEKLAQNQLSALPHILIHLDTQSLGRMAQVNHPWELMVHQRRVSENPCLYDLTNSLIAPGYDLNKVILSTLNAVPDSFTPLIRQIRNHCSTLPPDQKSLIKNKLPNLMDHSLSLYPWHLLKHTDALKTHKFKGLSLSDALFHKGFVRIKQVKDLCNTLATSIRKISFCLSKLNAQYDDYLSALCSSSPQNREIFISPVVLEGDFLKRSYLIPQSISYELLSMGELGIPEKKNLTGSSIVSHLGNLYAKQNFIRARAHETSPTGTLDPGMEWGMSAFHRLLFGEGMVPSSLLVLSQVPVKQPLSPEIQEEERVLHAHAHDNNIAATDREALRNRLAEDLRFKSARTSAVQITSEVKGIFLEDFLKQALQKRELFKELDKDQVQGLILSAMLTSPNDAKGDNFIVTNPNSQGKRQIIGIDNDLALSAQVIKEREDFHTTETRHLLFCIPDFMEQKITKNLQDKLLSLNAPQVVMTWLKSLDHRNKQYERLQGSLDPTAVNLLKLPLKLKPGTGLSLIKRIESLQRCLRSYTLLTPKLQNFFEEISPLNALYIKRLLKKEIDPFKAFNLLYRQDIPFEQLVSQEEDFNGHTLSELLAHEGKTKDAYKDRRHDVEDIAEEVLRNVKFDSFSFQQTHSLLEDAITSFPKALRAALPHLPPSIYSILNSNPSAALLEAMIECPSHRLKPHQMFNIACNLLKSSLPKKSLLLEKILNLPGFDYSQKDAADNTLLHLWAQFPHLPVPKTLWEKWEALGGDYGALNRAGESGLDRALALEHFDLIEGLLTLNKNKQLFYQEHVLEQFYQKIKTQPSWKNSSLHEIFRKRRAQDPHLRWVFKRSKLFTSQGEPIEILTYNQGRIAQEKCFLASHITNQLWKENGDFKAYHTNGHRMVGRVIFDSLQDSQKP